MDETVANQPFLSFSRIYAEQGYSTHFLYNGDLVWDNYAGVLRQAGRQALCRRR